MAIRPFPMMLMALAGVGALKLGVALIEPDAPMPAGDSLFVTPAVAATAEPEAKPAEETAEATPQACAMPEEMLQIIAAERKFLEEQKANLARREAEVALALLCFPHLSHGLSQNLPPSPLRNKKKNGLR